MEYLWLLGVTSRIDSSVESRVIGLLIDNWIDLNFYNDKFHT